MRSTPRQSPPAVLLAALLAACWLVDCPRTQTSASGWSDRFDAPGLNRRVFALGHWNGELHAGGPFHFLTGGGQPRHLARFDGRDWQPVGGGVDGEVRGIVEHGGELVVAGEFWTAGQSVPVNSIARWNGTRWAPLGTGLQSGVVPGKVFALAVHQGDLYAGGHFDTAGGQIAIGIARWDGVRWHAVGGGISMAFEPKVLAFASDGHELVVGGEFDRAGGVPALNVAAWNGTSWRAFGPGLGTANNNGVHALAHYQGTLYAGGIFGSSGGATMRRVARWDAAAGTWQPLGLGIPEGGRTSQVYGLEVYGGELWVAGVFGYVDGSSHGSGILASGLAAWNGSQWRTVGGVYRATFGGDAHGICTALHDGKLIVGGEFDHAGPLGQHAANVVSNNVIAWNGSTFEAVGEGLGLGDGTSGLLRWNGSLWSVENHHYAGTAVSPAVARFDGARWHTVGPFDPRTDIQDAIVFQDALHVVGDLWFADGRRMAGTIRFDGTTWTSLGGPSGGTLAVHNGELHCGGLGGVQRLSGGTWSALPSFTGQVLAMASFGGRLYLGGSNLGTGSGAVNLLAWDGTSLQPVGSGLDGSASVLCEHQGELWIGGSFATAGGVPSRRLARFDGTAFRSFPGPAIQGTSVRALESFRGSLWISGHLGVVGGVDTSLARWDGGTLTALGTGPNTPASTLLGDEQTGELWIGGGFFLCDDVTAAGLIVWHEAPRWDDLGSALPRAGGATPVLHGFGGFEPGSSVALRASGLPPAGLAVLALGFRRVDVPLFAGTLVPSPDATVVQWTGPLGTAGLDFVVPAGIVPGFSLFAQVWALEPSIGEVSATNAVVGR